MNHFILLDGARLGMSLQEAKQINASFDSLYRERSEEQLGDVAPYLFTFPPNTEFASFIFENGWSKSWSTIIETAMSRDDCWKHFRKFLMVKTEDGKNLYFRFYDPRVLKIFLPTCDQQQILEFFGPIEKFIVEGDTREDAIEFTHRNGVLQQRKISAGEIFGDLVKVEEKNESEIKFNE